MALLKQLIIDNSLNDFVNLVGLAVHQVRKDKGIISSLNHARGILSWLSQAVCPSSATSSDGGVSSTIW